MFKEESSVCLCAVGNMVQKHAWLNMIACVLRVHPAQSLVVAVSWKGEKAPAFISGGLRVCCVWGDRSVVFRFSRDMQSTNLWSKASVIHRASSGEGGESLLFVYPCCNDNDVMNEEKEGESGRKERAISRLMPGGMSDKPVYV